MSDLLERDLREALADRAARMNPEASARLRAVDYRRSSRWLPTRPVLGSVGLSAAPRPRPRPFCSDRAPRPPSPDGPRTPQRRSLIRSPLLNSAAARVPERRF
jgi:hypothetical protein